MKLTEEFLNTTTYGWSEDEIISESKTSWGEAYSIEQSLIDQISDIESTNNNLPLYILNLIPPIHISKPMILGRINFINYIALPLWENMRKYKVVYSSTRITLELRKEDKILYDSDESYSSYVDYYRNTLPYKMVSELFKDNKIVYYNAMDFFTQDELNLITNLYSNKDILSSVLNSSNIQMFRSKERMSDGSWTYFVWNKDKGDILNTDVRNYFEAQEGVNNGI